MLFNATPICKKLICASKISGYPAESLAINPAGYQLCPAKFVLGPTLIKIYPHLYLQIKKNMEELEFKYQSHF